MSFRQGVYFKHCPEILSVGWVKDGVNHFIFIKSFIYLKNWKCLHNHHVLIWVSLIICSLTWKQDDDTCEGHISKLVLYATAIFKFHMESVCQNEPLGLHSPKRFVSSCIQALKILPFCSVRSLNWSHHLSGFLFIPSSSTKTGKCY